VCFLAREEAGDLDIEGGFIKNGMTPVNIYGQYEL
jgi:hypothetical protein